MTYRTRPARPLLAGWTRLVAALLVLVAPARAQPNILLITSEDNGPELGCYGDPYARTPHLDALASRGVRFANAFVPYSVCSPSRGAIFTGLYPHQNGQMGLATHDFAMYRAWPVLPTVLHDYGYRTGLIGKLHVNPASAFTFDFTRHNGSNFNNRDVRAFADAARDYIEAGDEPFFLMVNFPDAHFPLHRQQHGWPIDPQVGEDVEVMPWVAATSPRLREFAADYYNCLSRLDTGVGMLLEALEASGDMRDTLVIYLGDHGAQFSRGKTSVYEAGLRVPMIMHWPGQTAAGLVPEQLVSSLDLFPTVLDAAGVAEVERPEHLQGFSLLPIARGETDAPLREYLYGERSADSAALLYPQRSVRDARYKLIHSPIRDRPNILHDLYRDRHNAHFAAGTSEAEVDASGALAQAVYALYRQPPEYELYDLQADPHELQDLSGDPAHAETKLRLIAALEAWQHDTRDPLADPELLRVFMREMDATREAGRRSPAGGWRYAARFEAHVWPAMGVTGPGDGVLVFSADRDHVPGHTDGVPLGDATDADMYQCFREPVAVRTNAGRLVVLCQAGNWLHWPERSGQDFCIATSDDGGRTWSNPLLAGEHGNYSMQCHGLVYDAAADRLIVLYTLFRFDFAAIGERSLAATMGPIRATRARGEPVHMQFEIHSDDGGETWSEPRDISGMMGGLRTQGHFGASEGRQLTVGDHAGRLLLPGGLWFEGDDGQRAHSALHVWRSDDGGATWQRSQRLSRPDEDGASALEARITELPDGSVLYNERTRGRGRWQARSTDGGETWTTLEDVPDLLVSNCNASLLTLRDDAGALTDTVLLSVPSPGGRSDGIVYISRDGGRTWPSVRAVADGFFAYSALVQIDAETVGLFYEANEYRDIRFKRLPITWLLAGDTDR